jgi:hypothetical protein
VFLSNWSVTKTAQPEILLQCSMNLALSWLKRGFSQVFFMPPALRMAHCSQLGIDFFPS